MTPDRLLEYMLRSDNIDGTSITNNRYSNGKTLELNLYKGDDGRTYKIGPVGYGVLVKRRGVNPDFRSMYAVMEKMVVPIEDSKYKDCLEQAHRAIQLRDGERLAEMVMNDDGWSTERPEFEPETYDKGDESVKEHPGYTDTENEPVKPKRWSWFK